MNDAVSVEERRLEIQQRIAALLRELQGLQADLLQLYALPDGFSPGLNLPRVNPDELVMRRNRQIWLRINEIGRDVREMHDDYFWLQI